MADLLWLADTVGRLTGPCRETDGDIANALTLYPDGWRRGVAEASATAIWFNDATGQSWSAPSVTASLDAAMTLVPKGKDWVTAQSTDPSDGKAYFYASVDESQIHYAATPALALTAASLRARSALEASRG